MGDIRELFFDKLPLAALIVNNRDGSVQVNSKCIKCFGSMVSNVNQIIALLGTDIIDLCENTKPNKSLKINFNNSYGENKSVIISCNNLNEEESIITLQEYEPTPSTKFDEKVFVEIYGELPIGIIIKNITKNKTLWISPYLISKTGYSYEDITEKSWQDLTYYEDIEKQSNLLAELDKSLNYYQIEKRVVSKSGKLFWFSEFVRHFKMDNDVLQLIILRDISTEKENEIELLRAKHKVEEAERLKTAFLDNMPHEIRTPLHAITGFTSLLSDPTLTHTERMEYIKFIQSSSNDILNLIDNIIEIAKLETNQINPKKEKCYINNLLDSILNEVNEKQTILEKDELTINIVKPESDPMFNILSDPERFYQIFTHLLNNALKFTDEGQIEFGYKLPKHNKIEFFVKDTGIGIPVSQLDIIFRKFGKSGNINTNKNRGTGLGLTLSKKLVELLNGEITVESIEGEGSKFSFILPIETEQKITINRPSVLGEIHWSSKTILVAEDTESNYFFIEAFLEKTNVNLMWAQDGVEAVELFKKNHQNINLVLMDIMMPEMDGYDATKELKSINSEIPIIAQTALALPDDEEKCFDAGCDYVLVKPINSEDLIATIRRFIL